LAAIHYRYKHLTKGFDDYIKYPKPNGYQSIHTLVIGPKKRIVEVQIRTEDMHKSAEWGEAAHWKYKEGSKIHPISENVEFLHFYGRSRLIIRGKRSENKIKKVVNVN
jgi:(p)ppGpp synthase/HD superfamily hydrolase